MRKTPYNPGAKDGRPVLFISDEYMSAWIIMHCEKIVQGKKITLKWQVTRANNQVEAEEFYALKLLEWEAKCREET